VFLAEIDDLPSRFVVYKPVRGERPLCDFPHGTLAGREYAAYLVSEAAGWHLVPPTAVREGDLGPGAVQVWVGDPYADTPATSHDTTSGQIVAVVRTGAIPAGWLTVVEGRLDSGAKVTVVHEDSPDVRSMAVFDAVINNADRKGSHALRDDHGRLWGYDHGVSLHVEPKLRTVLWGWAGQPFPPEEMDRLRVLERLLVGPGSHLAAALADALPGDDVSALVNRIKALLVSGHHPQPSRGWPSIPWPVL
jgi:uncharacterized repeat protein (TIGR03843 family)